MIALLGIKDILRQEVPGAIQKCKEAGVRVRMVTGDNLLTARAIALECGIIEVDSKDSLVMNGQDFINLVGGGTYQGLISSGVQGVQDKGMRLSHQRDLRKGEEYARNTH